MVTAEDQTKVYGESDPAFTVSYSGFVSGDDATALGGTLNLTREVGEEVGSYAITASGYTSSNYTIGYTDGTLDITPAALMVTAEDKTKVYGESDPAFTVSYSGFVSGDDETDLGGTLNLTREVGEEVGSYAITASGYTSSNYTIGYTDETLDITPASQSINFNPLPVLSLESDADFQLEAEASSGLPIRYTYSYTSNVPAAMVSVDGFVSLVQSGTILITASQDGNENYLPATPVTQELIVNSSDARITSLSIGDIQFNDPDALTVYTLDCDTAVDELEVSYQTEANATSSMPLNFTVDVSRPGVYRYTILITSQDGMSSRSYDIEIYKRFVFEEIVVQKFNNTLLVNNNPDTNGGYRFTDFTWYKNGRVIGNGHYFSEGDESSDLLDPLANYRVELTTTDGDVLSTCTFNIELQTSGKIHLAPNPVEATASATLFADFDQEELKNMKISILSLSGTLIDTFYTSVSKSTIQMPSSIQAGVYLLVCETSKQRQTVQFIVY